MSIGRRSSRVSALAAALAATYPAAASPADAAIHLDDQRVLVEPEQRARVDAGVLAAGWRLDGLTEGVLHPIDAEAFEARCPGEVVIALARSDSRATAREYRPLRVTVRGGTTPASCTESADPPRVRTSIVGLGDFGQKVVVLSPGDQLTIDPSGSRCAAAWLQVAPDPSVLEELPRRAFDGGKRFQARREDAATLVLAPQCPGEPARPWLAVVVEYPPDPDPAPADPIPLLAGARLLTPDTAGIELESGEKVSLDPDWLPSLWRVGRIETLPGVLWPVEGATQMFVAHCPGRTRIPLWRPGARRTPPRPSPSGAASTRFEVREEYRSIPVTVKSGGRVPAGCAFGFDPPHLRNPGVVSAHQFGFVGVSLRPGDQLAIDAAHCDNDWFELRLSDALILGDLPRMSGDTGPRFRALKQGATLIDGPQCLCDDRKRQCPLKPISAGPSRLVVVVE